MGFGHRVYKNYDPRAKVMREDLPRGARRARHQATTRCSSWPWSWSGSRSRTNISSSSKLYPNVDFYSGIILQAMGFPTSMFTVLFAVARTVGWIAQWNEMIEDPTTRSAVRASSIPARSRAITWRSPNAAEPLASAGAAEQG